MSTKLNVYGFGIQLKSQIAAGNHSGSNVAVISTSPEQARTDLVEEFVDDELVKISGPNVIVEGALYGAGTGSGSEAPTAPPACIDTPHVTGTGTVGQSLNCTMGNWSGEPTSYAYQWKSDDTTDLGSGADYTVLDSDAGHSLTCIVTATNALGSTDAPPSNAVDIAGAARSHHRK